LYELEREKEEIAFYVGEFMKSGDTTTKNDIKDQFGEGEEDSSNIVSATCREMGGNGREKVLKNSIFYVVGDLLSWYSNGIAKCQAKSLLKRSVSLVMVVVSLLLVVLMWQGYETMNYLYKVLYI